MGKRSGAARRRLTLDDVEQTLGELNTPDDAERWLRQIALWAAAGKLHGAVASACNRSVEVWIKARESKRAQRIFDEMVKRVEELERQLRQARVKAS